MKSHDPLYFLLTRPVDQGEAFIGHVFEAIPDFQKGYGFLQLPMLDICALPFDLPSGQFDGLIFTSVHAVRFFAQSLLDHFDQRFFEVPVYTVGRETEACALRAGFKHVLISAPDSAALSDMINGQESPNISHNLVRKRFLFVRGRHVSADFKETLNTEKFSIRSVVVYDAKATLFQSGQLESFLEGKSFPGVLFFSKRTAEVFYDNIQHCSELLNLKKVDALCISNNVLEAVRSFWEGPVYASSTPDRQGMTRLLAERIAARDR